MTNIVAITQSLLDKLESYSNRCIAQFHNQTVIDIEKLYPLVIKHYQDQGDSYQKALNNSQARTLLNTKGRLKLVEKLHHQHLQKIGRNLFLYRDKFFKIACNVTETSFAERDLRSLFVFYLICETYLSNKNCDFNTLAACNSVNEILNSGRLQIAFQIHQTMQQMKKSSPAHDATSAFLTDHARHLAERHAPQGEGLLTKVGGHNLDEAGLLARLRAIKLENDPDVGADNNQTMLQAANELEKLIRGGKLQDYLEMLQINRNKPQL